ncbi:MAG TPA: aldehyde dehydrogenase family protein, partial [Propylenella sp.]
MARPEPLKSRIAGADRAPEDGERFADINPATGEAVREVWAADAALVDEAVAAAKSAQRAWAALPAA